jgi:HAD superfamily hydrolase (TIGR01549 family)
MSDLSHIKLISIDLFRTLVPLPQSPEFIRRWYLDDKYPPDAAGRIEQKAEEILARRWDAAGVDSQGFISVRAILVDTLSELFSQVNLGLKVDEVADRIMAQHRPRPLFDDARPFLSRAAAKYPVCLSSDCDLQMLEGIDEVFHFDRIFTSDEMHTYKLNPRFFEQICAAYNFTPDQVMHIGDSKSDIIAPQQIGIVTCWLNRKNKTWRERVRPAYEVNDLFEALRLLGL